MTGIGLPENGSVNEGVDLPDGVPGNNCMSYTALCSLGPGVPPNRCTSCLILCNFEIDHLHPYSSINRFVAYLCECRQDEVLHEMCLAFDIPQNVHMKIVTNNSSLKIQCFDLLHRLYHHNNNELTLSMIKARLSEYSDELRKSISNYHGD